MAERPLPARILTAALFSVLLIPGPARAQRGNCIVYFPPPTPPSVFNGVMLPDHGRETAVKLAEALGIGTVSCRDPGGFWMEGAQLGPTSIRWMIRGAEAPIFDLPCRGAQPLVGRALDREWGCPYFRPMTASDQPASALQVLRVTALVPDVDRYCDQAMWTYSRPAEHLKFGPAFDVPELGARAREMALANGALRVMEPSEPDGPADRWLRRWGPGWMGFAVQVADGIAARTVLEKRGHSRACAPPWRRHVAGSRPRPDRRDVRRVRDLARALGGPGRRGNRGCPSRDVVSSSMHTRAATEALCHALPSSRPASSSSRSSLRRSVTRPGSPTVILSAWRPVFRALR
jgi:hypothetical protein